MAELLHVWTLVFLLSFTAGSSDGARILGLFPSPFRSHTISYTSLMQELARRGHQVTVVSGFPVQPPIANHTDITVHSNFLEMLPDVFKIEENLNISLLTMIWDMGLYFCDEALGQPQIQKLIQDKELEFDLIIIEAFLSDCFYGFVHKYKAPTIRVSSNTISLWIGDAVGNLYTPSYIPDLVLGFRPPMTFIERTLNTAISVYTYLSREFYFLPRQYAIIQKNFKDPSIPPIQEMERNASLFLINSHFSMNHPRPFTPNTIEMGGMHIKPAKRLPKDLQEFMDSAPEGVVYFSLGSAFGSSLIPEGILQDIVVAFSKLKQKILWKWDGKPIGDLPSNIRLSKWVPQSDLLAHPNLRVFMSHSGMLSSQEAIYRGVPMLAMPFGGETRIYAVKMRDNGCAVMLDLKNITSHSVSWALEELLSNPRYRENIKRMSALFRDRPQTPLETAVYWTEYVIRHRGAPHMRSASLDLWWFQYYLLDVLAVLLGAIVICSAAMWMLCRTVYRLAFRASPATKHNKEKKIN